MIRISLITPTRNRPNDLNNLLDSLSNTTLDKESVEILFAVDDCDTTMMPLLKEYETKYSDLKIKFYVVKRSDHFSKDYYNFLSLQANGRWVMCINDDSVFVTPNWDTTVCDRMDEAGDSFKDDILLGIVSDGMIRDSKPDMSCWCLSSKEYVNLMNGILIEELYTWGGDYWLGRVFKLVDHGHRKIFIHRVLIEHNSHHANPRREVQLPQPESFALFQRIQREHSISDDELSVIAIERANKINEYLAIKHAKK